MLYKSQIVEKTVYGTEEWRNNHLGKFTSSYIHKLIWQRGNGEGALDTIYRKAGELITGRFNPSGFVDSEFNIDATDWGVKYEQEAIDRYLEVTNTKCSIVKNFVLDKKDSRFGCVADAILVDRESVLEKDSFFVSTLEVKCPMNYERFIALFLCDTPEDLKAENKQYYWQVLHQMQVCGAIDGYFMAYHPWFELNHKIIHFEAKKLLEDLTLLNEKKAWAIKKLDEILEKFQVASAV